MPLRFDDIANRLKAFRLGSGLSAEEVAKRIGISRTALYRFEKGEVVKIETLEKLAELLEVSLPSLLGVGVEYIASAVTYFERTRQIEETAEHIIVLAGPLSYLLASDAFNAALGQLLKESIPETIDDRARAEAEVEEIMVVLAQRKETYRRRQPAIVNLLAASEITRFLINGMVGRLDLPDNLRRERRALARKEVEYFAKHPGRRAHRRADRHRAGDPAAYGVSDLPPAGPPASDPVALPAGRGAQCPRRRRHDHLRARSLDAASPRGRRHVAAGVERRGRGRVFARPDCTSP